MPLDIGRETVSHGQIVAAVQLFASGSGIVMSQIDLAGSARRYLEPAYERLIEGVHRLKAVWHDLNLAQQFVVSASLVLMPAMLVIGLWVSHRIQDSVSQRAGASAALYMESFVEPLIQDMGNGGGLSPDRAAEIGRLLGETPLGQRVLTFKIWGKGGKVVASSRPELVGKTFVPSEGLKDAWRGYAKAEFNNLKDFENLFEKASGIPLLEVYVPLRARGSDKVIAVGEFYEKEHKLSAELVRVQRMSWLVVGGVTLTMLTALFAIVARGSRTIEQQRLTLEQKVGDLTRLVAENQALRLRVVQASAAASESAEEYLRRFGADLHDGPAQLVSLAIMRAGDLDEAVLARPGQGSDKPTLSIHGVLTTALKELRNIATGLVLPEIESFSLKQTLTTVVERHEKLTGTRVDLKCDDLPEDVPLPLKVCVYRFVQEGLSNAFRHGGGRDQAVFCMAREGVLNLVVSNLGRAGDVIVPNKPGLGLKGLTARIECLGGTLEFDTRADGTTHLIAHLPLDNVVPHEL